MPNSTGSMKWILLIALAAIIIFLYSIDDILPFKAASFSLDRSQAITKANTFLEKGGYDLSPFQVTAMVKEWSSAFQYLQTKVGLDTALLIAQNRDAGIFSVNWMVYYYQNLPASAPQQKFYVEVTTRGDVCCFTHIIPAELDSLPPQQAHLKQDSALALAKGYIAQQGIDLDSFQVDNFSSQAFARRTDHLFRWKKNYERAPGELYFSVKVQGNRIDEFRQWYDPPPRDSVNLKAAQGYRFFVQVAGIVLFCIFIVLPILLFLKKYHEGEVGVGRASLLFIVLWTTVSAYTVLTIPVQAFGWGLGELSFDFIVLVKLVMYMIIIYPLWGTLLFTSWSVGESLARETGAQKLAGVDALFHFRASTLTFASSALYGYAYGFIALGGTALLLRFSLYYFNGTTSISGYVSTIAVYLPFLVPFLTALTTALMAEIPYRLFFNAFIYQKTHLRTLAVVVSAALFAVTGSVFTYYPFVLNPLYLELLLLFVLGLFFGALFWKYDLLTVLVANFVFFGVLQAIPIVTNTAPYLFYSGVVGLALLFVPVPFIIIGYLRKETFAYEADTTPAHIKRISERVRMAKELEIARQVQMKLLPKTSPNLAGCDVAGFCIPAKEVGGDYYDFIPLGEQRLGIAIGDVSGKGVPAAIYMTLTKGVFQSHAEVDVSPKKVLTKVNSLMYRSIERGSFVSMFYAIIDLVAMKMVYARAGHNPAIYFNRSKNLFDALEPAGIALGLERGEVFSQVIREQELPLQSGDLFVFYTDGFSEAMNRDQQQYSEERLYATIRDAAGDTAQNIIHAIYLDVKAFTHDYPQHDDMTMVVVKIH